METEPRTCVKSKDMTQRHEGNMDTEHRTWGEDEDRTQEMKGGWIHYLGYYGRMNT